MTDAATYHVEDARRAAHAASEAAARKRASILRHELHRAKARAAELRKVACSGWILDAERAALAAGEPANAYDGRPGSYPDLAARMCSEGLAYLARWPDVAQSYLAWALAYLEVAAVDLDGGSPLKLAAEVEQAARWVEAQAGPMGVRPKRKW